MDLIPFCTYTAKVVRPDFVGDTPAGHRVIAGVREARWEGDRFRASQRGETSADWVLVSADGTATPDVRMSLRTDDGAFVYVEYQGRADWSAGPGTGPVYVAPRFEVGDERYRWMNKVQFVAKGGLDGASVSYEVFELR